MNAVFVVVVAAVEMTMLESETKTTVLTSVQNNYLIEPLNSTQQRLRNCSLADWLIVQRAVALVLALYAADEQIDGDSLVLHRVWFWLQTMYVP